MNEHNYVSHAFAPVYNEHSRVLVLGTMPSPGSRKQGFYYSHPQNRFWKTLSAILSEELPKTAQQKRELVLAHRIALWDVLKSCEITGASDASIKNPVSNDLSIILNTADIRAIFATGRKAEQLYTRLCLPHTGIPIVYLPSTSPAHRLYSDEQLAEKYAVILPYLA